MTTAKNSFIKIQWNCLSQIWNTIYQINISIFTLWAELVIESPCLSVRMSLCLHHRVQFFFRPLIGPAITWLSIFFNFFLSRNLFKIVSVLLSASVERVGVSRMRDFLCTNWSWQIYVNTSWSDGGKEDDMSIVSTLPAAKYRMSWRTGRCNTNMEDINILH